MVVPEFVRCRRFYRIWWPVRRNFAYLARPMWRNCGEKYRVAGGFSSARTVCRMDSAVENGYRSSFSGEAGRAMVRTGRGYAHGRRSDARRSEEHTSEL